MIKNRKRGILIAGLVLALGTAVYLNWQFAPSEDYVQSGQPVSEEAMLGEALLVSAPGTETESDSDAVKVSAEENYFTMAYSQRENAREESLALLEDVISDASKSSADKTAAVNKSTEIASQIQTENAIETLIKAKGFDDCIAIVGASQASIIVSNTMELTSSEVSMITDIVMTQTALPASAISIIQPNLENRA